MGEQMARIPSAGLTAQEAAVRLARSGPNEISHQKTASPVQLFLRQFTGPMIWLLFGACALSAFLGEAADAIAIGAIVVLNGMVGFFQEYKAERALAALSLLTSPKAHVLRDGKMAEIPTREVVPGDLLILDAGDLVAADARLVESNVLRTNEAPLTGESTPVNKRAESSPVDAPVAERYDHIFLGTSVVNGTGRAMVYATGMNTELGKIARLLAEAPQERTPLQERLARVGHTLLWLCLAVVGVVAVSGLARGAPFLDVLLSATSLAVAAVPEGLPVIVTIALAVGVQRMAQRRVLVRHLPAVETLGCVTVICTDKTGTLTTGQMVVRDLWGSDHQRLLAVAASCCNAELDREGLAGIGDPTEIAILMAAAERGISRQAIERENPRLLENPFDSERKRMSIQREDGRLYVKGALETVVPVCRSTLEGVRSAADTMARRGLRVLAVAVGDGPEESDLELLGLIGMADPPRTDAVEAIADARRAGIRTVMITGDHVETARAIGREIGILRPLDDPEQVVHARVTPEKKILIVRDWKARGEIAAMTGDGVNDAPALKEAHVGIAMGKGGTEVAREAADIILTDDNYSSIVAGIAEGRAIYDNIQKTVTYLLGGNLGEILVMFAASVFGLPVPLLPLHILWVNLVTDGLPALALVTDPADPTVLDRPPREPKAPILGRAQWQNIGMIGLLQAAVTLSVFVWAFEMRDLAEARNLAFSTLVFGELFRSFGARSSSRTLWQLGAFGNLRLVAVVGASAFIQIGLHHIPWTQDLFGIGAISLVDCGLSVALGLIPVTVMELIKMLRQFLGAISTARVGAEPPRSL